MASRTELGGRLRAGALLLLIVAAGLNLDVFFFERDICFALIVCSASLLAFNEFCNLCEAWGIKPFRIIGLAGVLVMTVLNWISLPHWGNGQPLLFDNYGDARALVDTGLVLLVFGLFLRQAFIKDTKDALPAVGMTLLGVIYCWFLPGFLFRIRHLGGSEWVVLGHGLFIATIFISKIADVGAYFFGKKFGRVKLIPRISPGKSVEGAVFGLLSSVAMAFLLREVGVLPVVNPRGVPIFSNSEVVAFGLLLGGTGMCGDLLESILKRSGGHKDSSRMLPGYGGVLDVVDSVIIAAPPAYLFLRVVTGMTMGA